MTDLYQGRYERHQARKREVLLELMKERHSTRMFAEKEVPEDLVDEIVMTAGLVPSSCNRQAVRTTVVRERDWKALLGGLLVGGVGWVHRAPVVVMLWADPMAYKAEGEIAYMPFIDAGCVVQQLYLAATASGLHCCYINPNIREVSQDYFKSLFAPVLGPDDGARGIYVGCLAIGWPRED